jgi:hypothetical protein
MGQSYRPNGQFYNTEKKYWMKDSTEEDLRKDQNWGGKAT